MSESESENPWKARLNVSEDPLSPETVRRLHRQWFGGDSKPESSTAEDREPVHDSMTAEHSASQTDSIDGRKRGKKRSDRKDDGVKDVVRKRRKSVASPGDREGRSSGKERKAQKETTRPGQEAPVVRNRGKAAKDDDRTPSRTASAPVSSQRVDGREDRREAPVARNSGEAVSHDDRGTPQRASVATKRPSPTTGSASQTVSHDNLGTLQTASETEHHPLATGREGREPRPDSANVRRADNCEEDTRKPSVAKKRSPPRGGLRVKYVRAKNDLLSKAEKTGRLRL